MNESGSTAPPASRDSSGWLSGVVGMLTYLTVFAAAFMLALIGAFHIPNRPSFLGAHWPVAVIFAAVGNLAVGLLAGWGLQGRAGPAVAFLGWIAGVGLVMFGGSDDVVVGGTSGDWVPLGFLVAGAVASVAAVGVSVLFTDPLARPWLQSPAAGPSSSLRPSSRR